MQKVYKIRYKPNGLFVHNKRVGFMKNHPDGSIFLSEVGAKRSLQYLIRKFKRYPHVYTNMDEQTLSNYEVVEFHLIESNVFPVERTK